MIKNSQFPPRMTPNNEPIRLLRDCPATLIPMGTPVMLPAGIEVHVTQTLGGSYTVMADGNLVRIDGQNADALGFTVSAPASNAAVPTGPLDEELIWDQMRTCYDPEIPVNIVDLGLVYDCRITPLAEGGNRVEAKMTLTAPGCGMGEVIKQDVENRIRSVPGVSDVQVELVWDPPWNQSMMTDAAKLELGLM